MEDKTKKILIAAGLAGAAVITAKKLKSKKTQKQDPNAWWKNL